MQGYSLTMPKESGAGGQPVAGMEGRQGSNEGGSASRSKDRSSGEAEAASDPQPPFMQQQVSPVTTQCQWC